MNLERTKELIEVGADPNSNAARLRHVLEAAMELVSLPENDFSWSDWGSAAEARAEIESLLAVVRSGALPERLDVSVLFAPTGPLQEVSLSSGWADTFLKVAERFDEIESIIWAPRVSKIVKD